MKKTLLSFADKLLSKVEMKSVKGGYGSDGGDTSCPYGEQKYYNVVVLYDQDGSYLGEVHGEVCASSMSGCVVKSRRPYVYSGNYGNVQGYCC